jgi:hypothetical protein
MSIGVGKTSYSTLGGGARGYVNIGGWNTTLTDVASTAKETIGIHRVEGDNEYIYVQLGTAVVNGAGAFLSLATGYTDTNGIVAPFALTANGVASTGLIARGMTVCSSISGVVYAWVFKKGYATGYAMTDSGLAWNATVCPSTSTANLLDGAGSVTAGTAVGRVVGVTVATATAQAGSAGNLIKWSFKDF